VSVYFPPSPFLAKEIALMFRIALGATLVLALAAGSAFSQTKAQIKAQIKQVEGQIKALDRQEKAAFKKADAALNAKIRKLGTPDYYKKRRRAQLAQEEKDALALVTDPMAQQKIKAAFDQKRAQLLTEVKALDSQINQLKKQRKAANGPIKRQFHQQKQALRAQLKQLKAALKQAKK
jgi:hypothetical protein